MRLRMDKSMRVLNNKRTKQLRNWPKIPSTFPSSKNQLMESKPKKRERNPRRSFWLNLLCESNLYCNLKMRPRSLFEMTKVDVSKVTTSYATILHKERMHAHRKRSFAGFIP